MSHVGTPPPIQQGARIVLFDGTTYYLNQPVVTIGSRPEHHIVLPFQGVYPDHARICCAEESRNWWVEVVVPEYILSVNGQQGKTFWLSEGSKIMIGPVNLYFYR